MTWYEDPAVFLTHFGATVTSGETTGRGILNMPGQLIADGMAISTDYTLRTLTSSFGGLLYGDPVVVDNVNFQVKEVRLLDDGTFCEVSLMRLDDGVSAVGRDPRDPLNLNDLGDVDLTDQLTAGEALVFNGETWTDQNVDAASLIGNFDGGTFN